MSPKKKITSELTNCVASGLFLWLLPYAWKPLESGPSLCHIGIAPTVFGTGIEMLLAGSSCFGRAVVGVEEVVLCRFARGCCLIWRYGRRRTVRPAVLIIDTAILTSVVFGALFCWKESDFWRYSEFGPRLGAAEPVLGRLRSVTCV